MSVRRLVRTGALVVTAQVAIAVLGVVALRIYTGLVTPAVFGETNLILSALGLGMQLFVAGFVAAQLRFFSEAEARGAGDDFTRETLIWCVRSTAVLVGLALAVLVPLRLLNVVDFSWIDLLLGAAWLFAMAVRNVLMSRIQAERRQTPYAAFQVGEAVLLVGVTLAALCVSATVESFLFGQVLAIALFLSLLVITERTASNIVRSRTVTRGAFGARAWAYGAPFAPMSFLSWLANLGDRYTLAILLGPEAAGRYVAPFSIASRGMLLANSALCDVFRPLLFDAENRGDREQIRQTFVRWLVSSVALSLAGLAVVYVGGPYIARLLLAPSYRSGAVLIMLWVALGYLVSGVTQVVENRLLSLGHSGRLLLPMVMGAAANVVFSIVLIRRNGIVGAAQATCASFVFQNLATVGFLCHAMRRQRGFSVREAEA